MIGPFFETFPGEGDALLVVSPFYWTKAPLLSLHLLQAACKRAGLNTHIFYANLVYSTITSPDLHLKIAREVNLFLGERLFVSAVFGGPGAAKWVDKFSNPGWLPDHTWKLKPETANRVPAVFAPFRQWLDTADWERLESRTGQWVREISREIAHREYPVVGCSTSPGGLVPAIALLDGIKKANPNVITIIGGALCDGIMAEGVLSLNTGIDYVFTGEGEITFPEFVKKVRDGSLPGEKIIAGEPVKDLDTIPTPDYGDYFRQLAALPDVQRPSPGIIEIPYETSRGCWFGKCPFCGYFGKTNFYREKSPHRVIGALKELRQRHGAHTVYMTDNIMPRHYINDLFPAVSKEIPSLRFHFDIKSNLSLEQVISLKKAGAVSIEPGIESLSSSLLKRMRKGVTARENIALLRYARSTGLDISWFLLFGIPDEEYSEYEEMLRLFPLIRHLPPPNRILPMMIFRFSSYQKQPEAFGISNLRPAEVYNDILPSHAHLEKIAYYLTGDFKTQADENPEVIIALAKEFLEWKKAWAAYSIIPVELMLPMLHITRKSDDEYVLEDTRGLPGLPKRRVLNREQVSILLVPRPRDSTVDYGWAVDEQLGVLMDLWFVPLATAEPELLLEFEQEYKSNE